MNFLSSATHSFAPRIPIRTIREAHRFYASHKTPSPRARLVTMPQDPQNQPAAEPLLPDYARWSNEQLIQRVLDLEQRLRAQVQSTTDNNNTTTSTTPAPATPSPASAAAPPLSKKTRPAKPFDPSKYITRFVALKFAYLGAAYNGFEHHVGNHTPLPAIEEEVWKALVRCRLIFPPSLAKSGLDTNLERLDTFKPGETPVDWEGCEYSKCGRTDRGVSAFGQVIGLRVRSARKKRRVIRSVEQELNAAGREEQGDAASNQQVEEWIVDEYDGFDPIKDELQYIAMLNRVLPSTIRMLAWCPSPPANFDARFSCKEREYRYFFTDPAYLPIPGDRSNPAHTAVLDIEAMQEAASYFVGSHDFRNFCKIDPSKQLTEFTRKVRSATVDLVSTFEEVNPHSAAAVYCVRVHGSAFLWHQVRCMLAVLFLVGQGLEKPQVVKELLDVKNCPARPTYRMASDRPLVLWDCRFSSTVGKLAPDHVLEKPLWDRGEGADELDWIHLGDTPPLSSVPAGGKWNRLGIMENLWQIWRASKMDEILSAQLMDHVAGQNFQVDQAAIKERERSVRVFQGEDTSASVGAYVPLMTRKRQEEPEVANAAWAARKGIEARKARAVDDGNE